MPHTPWPDVQPPAIRVPNPTSNPAAITMAQLPGMAGSISGVPAASAMRGAATSPARKAMRQPRGPPVVGRHPAMMPLMPAMRPFSSISSTADKPISAPPIAAE